MKMIDKRLIFVVLIIFPLGILFSKGVQKKPLDHSVYEDWKYLNDCQISKDGNFISYEINPMQGDGFLVFNNVKTGKKDSISRGDKSQFSANSNFAAFRIEPEFSEDEQDKTTKSDSLGIYLFESDSLIKYPNLEKFEVAEDSSSIIAFLMEDSIFVKEDTTSKKKAIKKLVISVPTDKFYQEYLRVGRFDVSENGEKIVFVQTLADSSDSCHIMKYDTSSRNINIIYKSSHPVQKIKIDNRAHQIAFIAASDTTEETFHLSLWQEDTELPFLLNPFPDVKKANWTVSPNEEITFSSNDKKLFFGIAPVTITGDEDSTGSDYELDLWHWKDDRIQSFQKEHLEDELERSYLTCYNIENRRFVQIEDTTRKHSLLDENTECKYALAISYSPYYPTSQWTSPYYRDYYLINLQSGEIRLIAEETQDYYRLSPANRYVYWFDRHAQEWFVENTFSGKRQCVTEHLEVNFYNEEFDRPQKPYSYGTAGWMQNDEYLLLYDKYDIWKVDSKMNEAPTRLTSGREKSIVYRYVDIDAENRFLKEKIYITSFNEQTKRDGYARLSINSSKGSENLISSDHAFYHLKKAKNTSRLIWRKMSFADYSDLYYSDKEFKNIHKITNIDKQKNEYIWGTSELVRWETSSGKKLEGILYKPENFNPSLKYPLIVKIYAKTSDRLHSHYSVYPSRSIINYPFYVSNGYLIFKPDIQYETGNPGSNALESVVTGVNHLLGKCFIDEEHVGLIGHSWGGYEAAYIVTQSKIFAAAMAGAPVSNMTSAYGGIRWGSGLSRQKQYEDGQSRIGESLWENRELYIKNSPLFYADNVSTPLLILHNDRDGAVPWTQGIELFLALRRLQKPVWLLNYNNEKHSLKKWENRVDYSKRLFQYFNHYLKGKAAPAWLKYGIPATKKGTYNGYELIK